MPVVPVSGGPSVGPTPFRPPQTNVDTFGGGQAATPIDNSGLARAAANIYRDEKAKADQIAVVNKGADVSAFGTQQLTDALSQHGQNAFGLPEKVKADWDAKMADLESGLTNNDQKGAFRRLVASHWASIDEQVQRHVANERQNFDKESTASFVANEATAALSSPDPKRGEMAIANQQAAIKDFGSRNGWAKEEIDQHVAETVSKTRYDVLEGMVNNQQDLQASKYLADHRSDFIGKDLLNADRLTEAGSVRAESQRQGDTITSTATDGDAALQQVAQIQDPRVRDATRLRVDQFYSDKAANERRTKAATYQSAAAIVEQTGDFNKVPMATRLQLSPQENDDLQRRAEHIRNPIVHTNQASFSHLLNLASLNDATRAQFQSINLADPKYQGQFSDEDLKYLYSLQRSFAGADKRQAAKGAKAPTETPIQRKEETMVLKQMDQSRSATAARVQMQQTSPDAAKFLPPVARVVVPQWMADKAASDPEYANYLKMHGWKPATAPAPTPQVAPPPKVPGAPLTPPGLHP